MLDVMGWLDDSEDDEYVEDVLYPVHAPAVNSSSPPSASLAAQTRNAEASVGDEHPTGCTQPSANLGTNLGTQVNADEQHAEPAGTSSSPPSASGVAAATMWASADGPWSADGDEVQAQAGSAQQTSIVGATTIDENEQGHELVFIVYTWSAIFGVTDANATWDADEQVGGRSWGLKAMGSSFFSTPNAFKCEGRGARQPLSAPLGMLACADPSGATITETGLRIAVRIDWPSRRLFFALEGAGRYREAPERLPPDVTSLRPWVHATNEGVRLRIIHIRTVPAGDPPEPLPPQAPAAPVETLDVEVEDVAPEVEEAATSVQPRRRPHKRMRRLSAQRSSPFGSPRNSPPSSDDEEEEAEEVEVEEAGRTRGADSFGWQPVRATKLNS